MTTQNLTADALATTASQALDKNPKATLADALVSAFTPEVTSHTVKPPAVPVLTEEFHDALGLLPGLFARVTPKTTRALTPAEAGEIVREREVINIVMAVLTDRKDRSLREALAHHMDRVAEKDGLAATGDRTDRKGHYYVKHNAPAGESGKEIKKIVSEPKPTISSAALLDLHEKGQINREDYLALTSVPEVPRVFDEAKARKAAKKNPHLFGVLAQAVTVADPTITIKVD